ncbi:MULTISPECIES: DUF4296 domain-containing protein [Flavobacterium]|uniref:DUF4296 domain-containing protein n=1 Tax=Flavobacterium salmonis TaxID=2654844 RepID=A0A6V6YV95_9FLAO|nr:MULTISPECIES: DUF4296 domain-containing protein [Flavobacterium]OOV17126.1 hypothetical protein BXU10_19475 [Flavobacterium sp. LM4]CAD0003457.1 hypothetical protein FLAT13_01718 [Flavobacterium salmonis]
MKNFVFILLVLFLSVSCKKELVKEPAKLIAKEKMIDIIYDLSLLDAIKYQQPLSLDSVESNPKKFIFKKYKVDSLQFAQSNIYYAADYDNYKEMFDEINARLDKEKKVIEKKIKAEEKKAAKAKKIAEAKKAAEAKKKKLKETPKDSVKKVIKKINVDSVKRKKRVQHKGL